MTQLYKNGTEHFKRSTSIVQVYFIFQYFKFLLRKMG